MPTFTLNATFDGVNSVPTGGGFESWSSSGRIDRYSTFLDTGDDFVFNGTLDGADWRIRSMFVGEENQNLSFSLVDANANTGRRIESLTVDGEATISLQSTRIDLLRIFGDSTADHSVDVGGGRLRYLELEGNSSTVTTGVEYLNAISVFSGFGTITIGSGGAESINLSNGDDTVVLNGFVESTRTDGGNDTVTANVDSNSVRTKEGDDEINVTAAGSLNFADMGDGDDSLNINGGQITSVSMGLGNDTVILTGGARIDSLLDWGTDGGRNIFNLTGGSRIGTMQVEGDTTVSLNDTSRIFQLKVDRSDFIFASADGFVESIVGYEVSSTMVIAAGGVGQITFFADTAQFHDITINGGVQTLNVGDRNSNPADDQTTQLTVNDYLGYAQLGNGDNVVTTNGFVGTLRTGIGDDRITIGDADGAYLIVTREGEDTVTTGDVGVDAILTGDDDDRVTIGAGGAGQIETGLGDDVVVTGAGFVDLIATRDGNDTVEVGSGGVGRVNAGGGDDVIILSEIDPLFGVTVFGNSGVDTMDFSSFQTGVFFSLDLAGQFQNVGSGNITGAGVVGYFAEVSVENLIGSSRNDSLTGDGNANLLEGNKGVDTLIGGDGNDTIDGGQNGDSIVGGLGSDVLIGGTGKDRIEGNKGGDTLDGGSSNDFLRGGSGSDVFVFADGYGQDKIRDFQQGTDIMQISDHAGGFGTLSISTQGANLVVDYDGGTIILLQDAGMTLTAADFDFIV